MKNLLLIILFFPFIIQAQNLEGIVNYETTVKLDLQLDSKTASQFKHMLPKERKLKNVLHFKGSESIFLPAEENKDHEINENTSEGQIVFRMATPENKIYHNYDDNAKVESREFMGKYFLITGEPKTFKWKLTGEKKEIAGYQCQQAISTDTSQTTIAWFTPEIALSSGPGTFGKLPGLILGIESNDGNRITLATSVTLDKIDAELLVRPKKGKKVSQEEYDHITEEKMKEMGATRSGKGGVRMIIREEESGH